MTLVVYACSTNPGKLREFALAAREFGQSSLVIEPLPGMKEIPAPEENGLTFEENAVSKAVYYSGFTSQLVFADDSGLAVDALEGAPGIQSARFAGPDATDDRNNDLLLKLLAESHSRAARFVCVLALARHRRMIANFHGVVEGEVLSRPAGENGFGYDPLFYYPPLGKSFAALSPEEKLRVSHRGKALRKLSEYLTASRKVRREGASSHSRSVIL